MRIGFDARFVDDRYHGIGRFAWQLLEALTRVEPGADPDTTPDRAAITCPVGRGLVPRRVLPLPLGEGWGEGAATAGRPPPDDETANHRRLTDEFVVYTNPNRASTRLDLAPLLARPSVEPRSLPLDIYHPLEQPALALSAVRDRLDLFYSPYFPAPLLAACPVVTTVHDLIFDRVAEYGSGKWVRFYYRPMMRLAARKASAILAVSAATAADLRQIYGVPVAKIAPISEAADPRFQPVTDAAELQSVRERYRLPERFALALGAHRPHKNLATLIEAFGLYRDRFPHALVLAGEVHARYDDSAPAAIRRLGLGDRVLPTGHVADADLPALYTLADAFVQPSLIEGFGLPVLEAMGCGTPVVASNTSSLPEVVGDAGVLADPRDPAALGAALASVLNDPALRKRLRGAGLTRAAEFSWERAASEATTVFHRAADRA